MGPVRLRRRPQPGLGAIDAYAKRLAQGQPLPQPLGRGMAIGYAMVTGRPQAVMVHVIVGAANALGGLINAARSNVPMLFTAGRTPITEAGMGGRRHRPVPRAQGGV